MLKLFFSRSPGWIQDVRNSGVPAAGVILSDPQQVIKGVSGYQGKDAWIDVQVRVESDLEPHFDAVMKCRLSQAIFGMLKAGMHVNVRYDRKDKQRVLLMGDVNSLLSLRLKK